MSSPPLSRDALRDELINELGHLVCASSCGDVWFETDEAEKLIRAYEKTFVLSVPQQPHEKENISVAETIKLPEATPVEEPKGLAKGKDGYYDLQVQMNVSDGDLKGVVAAMLKLNELPENMDLNDPKSVELTFHHQRSAEIGFPGRGMVSSGTVVSVDTAADIMIVNIAIDNVNELRNWHLDHVAFMQINFARNADVFSTYRPGEKVYITIDLAYNYNKGQEVPAPVADAPEGEAKTEAAPAPVASEAEVPAAVESQGGEQVEVPTSAEATAEEN